MYVCNIHRHVNEFKIFKGIKKKYSELKLFHQARARLYHNKEFSSTENQRNFTDKSFSSRIVLFS